MIAAVARANEILKGDGSAGVHLLIAGSGDQVEVLRHEAHRTQTGGVDCHPCWKTTCARQDRACLMRVKPDAVLSSCAHSLERGAKRREMSRNAQ